MHLPEHNLAIETSARIGSVALGCGDQLLESAELPAQQRHAVELLPRIDAMMRARSLQPSDLAEIYLSIGPGSFTGLRIGVTVAKMIARVTGCRLVSVPTLDVIVRNLSADSTTDHVAVMLNAKRGQCFTGLYQRDGDDWQCILAPALLTPAQLCERAPRPLSVIGDHLPDYDWPADVTLITDHRATPRANMVWRLGRDAAGHDQFVDPYALAPLYVRLPEAEEKWQLAQGEQR